MERQGEFSYSIQGTMKGTEPSVKPSGKQTPSHYLQTQCSFQLGQTQGRQMSVMVVLSGVTLLPFA